MNLQYNLFSKGIFIFILCFPFILFSQSQSPLEASLQHLEEKQKAFDLTTTDISNYRISDLYSSKHNGITHIYLQQQHEGIDLQNATLRKNKIRERFDNQKLQILASNYNTSSFSE